MSEQSHGLSKLTGECRNKAHQHLPTSYGHYHPNQLAKGAANLLDLLENAYLAGIPEAGLPAPDRDVPAVDDMAAHFFAWPLVAPAASHMRQPLSFAHLTLQDDRHHRRDPIVQDTATQEAEESVS